MILAKPQIHLACWVFSFFEKNLFDASINQVKVESTNVSKKSFLISSFSPYILGTKAFLKNPKKPSRHFLVIFMTMYSFLKFFEWCGLTLKQKWCRCVFRICQKFPRSMISFEKLHSHTETSIYLI